MDSRDHGVDAGGVADGDGSRDSSITSGPTPDPSGQTSNEKFSGPTPRSDVPVYHGQAGPPHRYNDGRPEVGRNFYITREQIERHNFSDGDDDVVSLSSLSAGGISTMTKLVGMRYDGLELRDIESAVEDDRIDNGTTICPSVAGGGDLDLDDDVYFDAVCDRAYAVAANDDATRVGNVVVPPLPLDGDDGEVGPRRREGDDTESCKSEGELSGGGSSDVTTSSGRSSLSSITNDFVPTYDERGIFLAFLRRGKLQQHHHHRQPQQHQRQQSSSTSGSKQSNGGGSFSAPVPPGTPPRIHRVIASPPSSAPWHRIKRSTSKGSASAPGTPTTVPNTPDRSHNPLGDEFAKSQELVDVLPLAPKPPLASSDFALFVADAESRAATATNGGGDEGTDGDDGGRSVGFGAYVYRKFDRRRRCAGCVAILVLLVIFSVVLIAIAALDPDDANNVGVGGQGEDTKEIYDPSYDFDPLFPALFKDE